MDCRKILPTFLLLYFASSISCTTAGSKEGAATDSSLPVDMLLTDSNIPMDAQERVSLDSVGIETVSMDSATDNKDITDNHFDIMDVGVPLMDTGIGDVDSVETVLDMVAEISDMSDAQSDMVEDLGMQVDIALDTSVETPEDMGWVKPELPEGLNGNVVADFPAVVEFAGVVNSDGLTRTLADLKGKPTVLWFYPAASTSG